MPDDQRPNVLFIAMDDMNEWIGCAGVNPDVKTPNIDRLASEGMYFSNACCASPVCNPSRTAFLTGMRPTTTGCYLLSDNLELSPEGDKGEPFPLHFRHNGYWTMMAGKVDHGCEPIERSTQANFGESMWDDWGGFFNGQQFNLHPPDDEGMTDTPGAVSHATHWGPVDEDLAETLSDNMVSQWAVDKLQADYDQPFLLAAGFFRPHTPLIAPRRFFDMYDRDSIWMPPTGPDDMEGMPQIAREVALTAHQEFALGTHRQLMEQDKRRDIVRAYLACVSFVDDCIGRVLQALEESPYADNTIVVLASDNGYSFGEHFHYKKWSIFDSGSRVPFIVKAPGMDAMGERCEEGVDLVDIYPTLVDLCSLPDPGHLDGESLRGLLSDVQARRERPALTSYGPNNHSLRNARYRYSRYDDGSEELYDYREDPWEHSNLADDPKFAEVKKEFIKWLPEDCAPAVISSPPPGGPLEVQPGDTVLFHGHEAGFAQHRIRIQASVELVGSEGVIVHHGGYFAGYALYIKDRRLCLSVQDVETPLRWDRLDPKRFIVEADSKLPEGRAEVEAVVDMDGSISITINGNEVGRGKADSALSIYPTGHFEAGQYTNGRYPSMGDYDTTNEFPGTLENIYVIFES